MKNLDAKSKKSMVMFQAVLNSTICKFFFTPQQQQQQQRVQC